MSQEEKMKVVQNLIAAVPDFPKPGILFRDVFPVFRDPKATEMLIDLLVEHIKNNIGSVDVITGLDARGFLFAPIIAMRLDCAFAPVRKAKKLPGECVKVEYELEYGKDAFEMQKASIKPGDKVVIVDDLIATGGSLAAAIQLTEQLGGEVMECLVVIELKDLQGHKKLGDKKFHALVTY